MSFYVRMRQKIQPYYRPKPKELLEKEETVRSLPEEFEPGLSVKNLWYLIRGKVTLDDIFKRELEEHEETEEPITKEEVVQEIKKVVTPKQETPPKPQPQIKSEPQSTPKPQKVQKPKKPTINWRSYNERDLIVFSDMKPEEKKKIVQITQARDNELYRGKMRVVNAHKRLDKINLKKSAPKLGTIWTYHDETCQQLIAHVPAMGRNRTQNRSSEVRATLEPTYTTTKQTRKEDRQYDRTHMIPFDYVNTENDYRLVVPFSSELNQGEIAKFENKMSQIPSNLIWCTFLDHKPWGVKWVTKVYTDQLKLIETLEVAWGSPEKPVRLRRGMR